MNTQGETTEREQAESESGKSLNLLERYRMTAWGSAKSDFSTVESALFGVTNKLAVAGKAIHGLDSEADSDSTGLIMGIEDILNEARQTMEQALSMLDGYELKRG